jgi:hypothetical protein
MTVTSVAKLLILIFCWRKQIKKKGKNIIYIHFTLEKLGDDHEILDAIAPAVENASCIEMSGEEGDLWRWVFKDGRCQEIFPKIIWG